MSATLVIAAHILDSKWLQVEEQFLLKSLGTILFSKKHLNGTEEIPGYETIELRMEHQLIDKMNAGCIWPFYLLEQ
jgi:hypothetical protein